MKELLAVANTFNTSRPIFALRSDGQSICLDVRNPVFPYIPIPIGGDAISELVCSHYKERFDPGSEDKLYIDRDRIVEDAMSEIRNLLRKFVERNSKLANPKQGKLYRYMQNMQNDDAFNDILVMVYKYIRTFANSDLITASSNQAHVDNTIALLEAIMEKHEQ